MIQHSSDLGEVDEPGKLTRQEVDGVLKDQRRLFFSCYQRAVDRKTVTDARVVIAFMIGDDGTVTGAHVAETNSDDPALDRCLIAVIEGLLFPEGSPTRVRYPFIFISE